MLGMNVNLKTSKLAASVLIALGLSLGHVPSASAQAVDPKTRDMLIEKLTQVYLNLAPADASKVAITLRLADLHAERARLEAMKELEAGCTTCTAGVQDRKKALGYYQEVLPKVQENSVGKVLAQVGHLYEMTGNEKDAIATYERILKDPKSASAQAEANVSLAEVYFKRRDYAQAKKNYQAVLANPSALSKGLAAYRSAWCDFNEGHLDLAINGLVTVLKTPELSARTAPVSGVAQIDKQFQEEVSRDLATFMARRQVAVADAALLYEVSPEAAKIANVTFLASELERLGQPQGAIALWKFAQEKQSKPEARLEGHIRLAQLEMEQKQLASASKDFESALAIWSSLVGPGGVSAKSEDQNFAEYHSRLRKFVTDWNRSEKAAPSEGLLNAYQAYLKTFSNESDMYLWAGKVASDLKQYPLAIELSTKAAKTGTGVAVEGGLLQAIEAAELSKDQKLLATAYDSYLANSKDQKKALEVRYQKARGIYDAGDYAAASVALREVALGKDKGSDEVKSQAAELSLDSLVLMKDDTRLEAWASDYAKAFPKNAKDFQNVSRKSVLTQAAAIANKGDQASLEQAWSTLNRFDLSTAQPEDKAAFYKNKLVLAEKMGKFGEARDAVENMLRLPSLTAADQQYALSRKAWLAEMLLDFDTALTTTQKLTATDLPKEQKSLKLAMYAELASKDAKPFYAQFLKDSKDAEKNASVAAQLVLDSKEPAKELKKNKALIAKSPTALADLYLDLYGKTGSVDMAKEAITTPAVASTDAGKVLRRAVILDDYAKLKVKLAPQTIDSSNQKKLSSTMKTRIGLLEDAEKLATRAIESGDWTAQLATLDLLGKESERFYQEVLALPMPEGLSAEEESQYLSLLSQQAAPHQIRANDVTKKVGEFWQNEQAMTQLEKSLDEESGARRKMVMAEVTTLSAIAPESKKAALQALASKQEVATERPTLATIEGAKQAVREAPLNRDKLTSLLTLVRKMNGQQTMVSYLEGRLASLESSPKTETGTTK